jgi:two-component system OmpR family response regulator
MGKLIFFVDDDKMMLNLLEYTLKNRQDYDIKTFTNGDDCLANLDDNPDLIVIDLKFNGNSKEDLEGINILKQIKKKNNKQEVVILSSYENDQKVQELLDNGASRFIPKNDYFIDAIMEMIDSDL